MQYIDVSAALLDAKGNARPEFLRWDGLHPSRKGYEVMTSIIKPVLMTFLNND